MDIQYLLFLQGLRETAPSWLNKMLLSISELSVGGALLLVMLVYWCINKRAGLYLLLCQAGATVVNQVVKNTACIYRPWVRDPRVVVASEAAATATGYSFPSGHTTNAVACYGGLAMWQHRRKWLAALLLLVVLLTGFARNWLCAHTPQDVLVALLLAGLFLFVAAKSLAWLDEHPGREGTVLAVGLVVLVALLLYTEFKPYPLDYLPDGSLLVDPYQMKTDCYKAYGAMAGLLLGWYADQRWIHFRVEGKLPVRIVRFVVGVAFFLAFEKLAPALFVAVADPNPGGFLLRLTEYLCFSALYPAVFTALEKRFAPVSI